MTKTGKIVELNNYIKGDTMDNIKVDMENLSKKEREQLIGLIKKANQKPKKRWRAEPNEKYYFINYSNRIESLNNTKHYFDENLFKVGNYFKTKEEAEFELNRRLVYQELKDYALEHNEIDINWSDTEKCKWSIRYDYYKDCLTVSSWWYYQELGQIYFSSQYIALDAIKVVGRDRIKKYLFGVVD